jgi:hypothetical protein
VNARVFTNKKAFKRGRSVINDESIGDGEQKEIISMLVDEQKMRAPTGVGSVHSSFIIKKRKGIYGGRLTSMGSKDRFKNILEELKNR